MTSSTVDDHRALRERLPAGGPAQEHRQRKADPEEERRHPQDAQPAGRGPAVPAGRCGRRRVQVVLVGVCDVGHWFGPCARYCTSCFSLSGGICVAKMCGIAIAEAGRDVGLGLHDRLLDERVERAAMSLRGLLRQVVEVRADRPRRAGGLEGVAAGAAVLLEHREPGRPGARRAARLHPLRVVGRREDPASTGPPWRAVQL